MGDKQITCQLRTWGAFGHGWPCWSPDRVPSARFLCSKTLPHFRKHKSCPSTTFGGGWTQKYLDWLNQKPCYDYAVKGFTISSLEWSLRLQTSPKVVTEQLLSFRKCFCVLKHKNRAQGAREGLQQGHPCPNAPHVLNWHVMTQSPIFVCKVKNMHS